MRYYNINHPLSYRAGVHLMRLSCWDHMLLASLLGAMLRHEAVISPVTVNLQGGELSQWLPADYSLILRSSWLSPAEYVAGEKWTMATRAFSHT